MKKYDTLGRESWDLEKLDYEGWKEYQKKQIKKKKKLSSNTHQKVKAKKKND